MSTIKQRINEYFLDNNYQIVFWDSCSDLWIDYHLCFDILPIYYEHFQFAYLSKYNAERCSFTEATFLLVSNRSVLAVVPLSLNTNSGCIDGTEISFGAPLFCKGVSNNALKKALIVIDGLYNLCINSGWLSKNFILNINNTESVQSRLVFDFFNQKFINKTLSFDLIVNERGIQDVSHSFIRKSYRSLINQAKGVIEIKIYDSLQDTDWKSFQNLHKIVSGRVTRNDETWEIQKNEVNMRSSFCVAGFYGGRLVGWALAHVGVSQAIYAAGVYDRDLRNLNISHLIQKHILMELRKLSVRNYILGEAYCLDPENKNYSNKMASIDAFKRGFANDRVLKISLQKKRGFS